MNTRTERLSASMPRKPMRRVRVSHVMDARDKQLPSSADLFLDATSAGSLKARPYFPTRQH